MEKRISVFIGRTIFLLVKNCRISILIGYTVFLTSEENHNVVSSFCSQNGRRVGEGAKGLFGLCQKEEKFFRIKTCEAERRTALV